MFKRNHTAPPVYLPKEYLDAAARLHQRYNRFAQFVVREDGPNGSRNVLRPARPQHDVADWPPVIGARCWVLVYGPTFPRNPRDFREEEAIVIAMDEEPAPVEDERLTRTLVVLELQTVIAPTDEQALTELR